MLIFDAETGGNLERARALMPVFDEKEVKTGNIRDDEKIRAKVAERRASHEKDWLESAALRPETATVLAIGILPEKGEPLLLHGTGEAEILQSWWDFLETTYQKTGKQFGGWSIFHFDLPLLIIRSRILGVGVPQAVRQGRYFNATRFLDLEEQWIMNRPRNEVKHSLNYVAKALDCGEKTGEGSNFSLLYNLDQKQALAYLSNDLLLCQKVARKLGFMP
jgi:hypothetical protein